MLLGIEGVVAPSDFELGRFYLGLDYDGSSSIFQCVDLVPGDTVGSELAALWFKPDDNRPLQLGELPSHGPAALLPPVHVRVDAPSMSASNYTSGIRSGMFVVSGEEAFVAVPAGFRGWRTINIVTGKGLGDEGLSSWLSFSRWQLVVHENGEEIAIADFGASDAE